MTKKRWYILCYCDDEIEAENEDKAYEIFCEKHDFNENDARFVSYSEVEMTKKRFKVFKTSKMIGIDDNGESVGNIDSVCALLNELNDENEQLKEANKELKEINQDHQDHILLLEEEKINLQIKLQKIRDYAMENGEVKQDVIEKVVFE